MILKYIDKPPKLDNHYEKGDLEEHVQLMNDLLSYSNIDGAYKCKLFVLTLVGSARFWFNGLPYKSIDY